jgi:ribokinase
MAKVSVLGSANLDIVASVERLALPGETVFASNVTEFAGGKGLNQAIAAARLGADVQFLAAVGDDDAGRFLCASLAREGVHIDGVALRSDVASGRALIAVAADGENCIIVSPGANATLRPDEAAPVTGAVLLAQLETPLAAVAAFFAAPGLKLLNAAPANPDARSLLGLIDILIVNEVELLQLAGRDQARSSEDFVQAARSLSPSPATIVVTLGGDGVLAVTQDSVIRVAALSAQVMDTTGAGDCFCGALATALGEGMAMEPALGFANRAAAWSVTQAGASSSMPYRRQLAD